MYVIYIWASLVAQLVKSVIAMQETWVRSLTWEDPLEKETATLRYICLENPMDRGAWRAIAYGVARVGHDGATKGACTRVYLNHFVTHLKHCESTAL